MLESLKIAVVEDDSGLNELIRRRLSREKHECFGFYRADEAVTWLKENAVNLIIIDLVLPDSSGEDLIAMLHQHDIKTPFIVATGQGSEAVAVKMLKKGARDYLVKNAEFLNALPSAVEMVWREVQLESLLSKAREKIRLQNATLGAVHEFSPDGVIVVDHTDKILSINSSLLEMWKIDENSVPSSGKEFFKLVAESVNNPADFLNKCLEVDEIFKGLLIDDIILSEKNLQLYSAPMTQDKNQIVGRIWYFRDISIHKEAEREKEKARLEAESNARMRSHFFAVVSHDVKAPLNAIVGYVGLLESAGINPRQQEYIEVVKNSCDHLLNLVNDILDLTKIEHGALEFHIQNVSLREVLQICLTNFVPNAKETGVELSCEIDEKVPDQIQTDQLRIKQIVMNLLSNAMKFTSKGFVRIECELYGEDQVSIKVVDSGIGVDSEVQKFIFTPFSQADPSITQKYGGSGLGLAIAKQLIEQMGGSLTLESKLNHGSQFTLIVPIQSEAGLDDHFPEN